MKKLTDLLVGLDYKVLSGSLDRKVCDVVYDSRKLVENCLFVCIKGLGLALLHLSRQMRCLRFCQSVNSPLRIQPLSVTAFFIYFSRICISGNLSIRRTVCPH